MQNALVENEEEKEGKDGDGEKKKGDQVKTFDLGRLRTYTFKARIFILFFFPDISAKYFSLYFEQ